MIDFLKECNIDDKTINEIEENNESFIYNLSSNENDAKMIISYLKSIGVKNVEKLLINRIDLFFKSVDEVKKMFSKVKIPLMVNLINEDCYNIELLF